MKTIKVTMHTPSTKLGGVTKNFSSIRVAKTWIKKMMKDQPCGWSVCQAQTVMVYGKFKEGGYKTKLLSIPPMTHKSRWSWSTGEQI